jgi:hypothetical protein
VMRWPSCRWLRQWLSCYGCGGSVAGGSVGGSVVTDAMAQLQMAKVVAQVLA